MSKTLPYMRWYVSDAESDEKYASLNDQELGFFHRCINKAWVNGGIPADMGQLASLMKVSPAYLKKVWPSVGRCWYQDDDRFYNRRQEEEREKVIDNGEKASTSAAYGQSKAPGFIYLIRRPSDSAVKIGSSLNVSRRLAQLRYKYQEDLVLVDKYQVSNMSAAEVLLHENYKEFRMAGEWYEIGDDDILNIAITLGGDKKGDTEGDLKGDNTYHTGDHTQPRALARAESESECVYSSSDSLKLSNEEKPSSRARGTEAPKVSDPPRSGIVVVASPEWKRDESFAPFVEGWRKTGAALIDEDFEDAHRWVWKNLDFEQKRERMEALNAKLDAGGFPDPKYICKPRKFLEQEWKRKTAPQKAKGSDFVSNVERVISGRLAKGEQPW